MSGTRAKKSFTALLIVLSAASMASAERSSRATRRAAAGDEALRACLEQGDCVELTAGWRAALGRGDVAAPARDIRSFAYRAEPQRVVAELTPLLAEAGGIEALYRGLAHAHAGLGDDARALELYTTWTGSHPQSREAWFELGSFHAQRGNGLESAEAYAQVLRLGGTLGSGWRLERLAHAYLRAGAAHTLEQLIGELAATRGESPELAWLRGEWLEHAARDPQSALAQYAVFLRSEQRPNPQLLGAVLEVAFAASLGSLGDALFEEQLAKQPETERDWFAGQALAAARVWERALPYLERAVVGRASQAYPWGLLAEAQHQLGSAYAEEEVLWRGLAAVEEGAPRIQARLARLLLEAERYHDVVSLYDGAAPEPTDLSGSYAYGVALMQIGRLEEALGWIERSLPAGGVLEQLGRYQHATALAALGRQAEAREELERFLALTEYAEDAELTCPTYQELRELRAAARALQGSASARPSASLGAAPAVARR